ncbi:transcription factor E2F5-like [Salarias fasciatus]|uniref:transcription factor E2F5-like n=1 Tax=Salarias fasciatus TaxID=181472 RepID=UPI001176A29A|nr:transcription factor E2F5-like [Salarias fasciatus]
MQLLAFFNTSEGDPRKFQMKLRSLSAPIHVKLLSTDSERQLHVVLPVPPVPPAPLSPPVPASASITDDSSQDSPWSSQQVALSDGDELPALSPSDVLLAVLENQQQKDLDSSELQPLLRLGAAAAQTDHEYAVALKNEFLSTDDADYSYNLDGREELFDLFNMQLLHY